MMSLGLVGLTGDATSPARQIPAIVAMGVTLALIAVSALWVRRPPERLIPAVYRDYVERAPASALESTALLVAAMLSSAMSGFVLIVAVLAVLLPYR